MRIVLFLCASFALTCLVSSCVEALPLEDLACNADHPCVDDFVCVAERCVAPCVDGGCDNGRTCFDDGTNEGCLKNDDVPAEGEGEGEGSAEGEGEGEGAAEGEGEGEGAAEGEGEGAAEGEGEGAAEGEGEGEGQIDPCDASDPFGADIDGDCLPDLVVGAPGVDGLGDGNLGDGPPGSAQAFLGNAQGQLTGFGTVMSILNFQEQKSGFGISIAIDPVRTSAGRTFVVGEPFSTQIRVENPPGTFTTVPVPQGMAWLFVPRGTGTCTNGFPSTAPANQQKWCIGPFKGVDNTNGRFGASMAYVGGTGGESKFVMGAPGITNVENGTSAHAGGGASGFVISILPDLTDANLFRAQGGLTPNGMDTVNPSNLTGSGLGTFVTRIGDIDSSTTDSFTELAVSGLGLSNGGARAFSIQSVNNTTVTYLAVKRWATPSNSVSFATVIADVGDLDADGKGDVAFGAPQDDGGNGAVYIALSASNTGTVGTSFIKLSPDVSLGSGAAFGASIASLGDVDGDGFIDIAVGAPYADDNDVDTSNKCQGAPGAPSGTTNECVGAVVVLPGIDFINNSTSSTVCVARGGGGTGTGFDRLGTDLRAFSRVDADTVRIAAGAPGLSSEGDEGRVQMLDITVDSTTCAIVSGQSLTLTGGAAKNQFGAALGH